MAAGKDSHKAQRVKAKTEAREEEVRQTKEAKLRESINHISSPKDNDEPKTPEIDPPTEQTPQPNPEDLLPVDGEAEAEAEIEDCSKFKAMLGQCKGKIEEWMEILESNMNEGQLKAFYEGHESLECDMMRAVAMRKFFFLK